MKLIKSIAAIAIAALTPWETPVYANEFMCAGVLGAHYELVEAGVAAKVAQGANERARNAVVLFASFRDGTPEATAVPAWASGIFDPDLPGSFSHFYDTMSFGRLTVRGEVVPIWYESEHAAAFYLSPDPAEPGDFGQFSLEILRRADADVDTDVR